MRTEHAATGQEEDRLSTEELVALRARLWPEKGPDAPATVADIAAALGRSPEEVWQQLDRIRAEQAFSTSGETKRRSQWPLLGLAVVLLGAAYTIRVVTPRPLTEEEIEQQLEETRQIRARKPKRIRYPIETNIKLDRPMMPATAVTIQGLLTVTTAASRTNSDPMGVPEATQSLYEALKKAYEAAREAEAKAPPPPQPLKKPNQWGMEPTKDAFTFGIGRAGLATQGMLSINPPMTDAMILDTAKRFVESTMEGQKNALKGPPRSGGDFAIMPPPGFSVTTIVGQQRTGTMSNPLALVPVDPVGTRLLLNRAIRDQIRRQLHPDTRMFPSSAPRLVVPAEVIVEATGPAGLITAKLPMRPGGEFRTAADALRAYESRLSQLLDKAEKQIRILNSKAKGNG